MPKKPKCKRFRRFKTHKSAQKANTKAVLESVPPRRSSDIVSDAVERTVSNSPRSEPSTYCEHPCSVLILPSVDTPPVLDVTDVAVEDCAGVTNTFDSVECHQNPVSEDVLSCVSSMVDAVASAVQIEVGTNSLDTNSVGQEVTEKATDEFNRTGGEGVLPDDVISIAHVVNQGDVRASGMLVLLESVGVSESLQLLSEEPPVTLNWKELEELLKLFLPSHCKTHIENDCLSILVLSKGANKVVQRTLVFKPDGVLELYVHGKIVKHDNRFFGKIGSLPSILKMSAKVACDKIASVLKVLKDFQTCVGASDEKYERFWADTKRAFIESGFEEYRYRRTLRSHECEYIVLPQFQKCSRCTALTKILYQKFKRAALVDENVTPHKKKPNAYLRSAEKKRRAQRQQKDNRNQKLINERLRTRLIGKLDNEGIDLDININNTLKSLLDKTTLTPFQKIFIESQIQSGSVKKKCGMKWHPAMIRFALNLQLHSSKTTEIARRFINLPGERTLFDYSHVHESKEGVSHFIIEDVVTKIDVQEAHKFDHILSFDEMYISQHLVYNKETGAMVGYCNLNDAEREINEMEQVLRDELVPIDHTPPIAKTMLSFMIRGAFSSTKEVVASYSVHHLSKEFLFERHWEVVEALEMSGVRVRASVCDGAPINRSFFQMHIPFTKTKTGVVCDTINMYAPEPDCVLHFFSDVPHLLKTIRNCLETSARKLTINNQHMSWDTIVKVYNETKHCNLRQCFKIDAQCVFLNPFSRMRVSYATSIFSKSMVNELTERNYDGTSELIKFLQQVNNFFDMLNGQHKTEYIKSRNSLLAPYTCHSDGRLGLLDEFFDYLWKWKDQVEKTKGISNKEKDIRFLSRQTMEGIDITITSFRELLKDLLPENEPEGKPEKYIMSRVVNQDSLEQYFSQQRGRCGGSNNPNVAEFTRNANTIHVLRDIGSGARKCGNTLATQENINCDSTPLPKRQKRKTARGLFLNTDVLI